MDDGGTINGGADTSGTQQFTITVGAVNDAPSFTMDDDPPTIVESSGAQSVPFFATDIILGPADESVQFPGSFVVTIFDSTGDLAFDAQPAIDPSSGQLTYTPSAGTFGTATFDVFLMDDGGTDDGGVDTSPTQQFTVTVTAINSAPSFTLPNEQPSSLEDALPVTIPGFASNIDKGAPADAGQVLTFDVTNDNEDLFAVQPAIDPVTGDLTYTAAPDANGTAIVDVFLMDDGGTVNGGVDTSATEQFTITVGAVNDAPSFNFISDLPADTENTGAKSVPNFATDILPGPATATDESGQILAFDLSDAGTTGGLTFAVPPAIDPDTGELTYTPSDDSTGTATFDVVLMDDGGTADGGVDTSPTVQFTITVNPPNAAPTFTILDDAPSSLEDDGFVSMLAFASDVDAGAPEESGQTLEFHIASNSNEDLFSVLPAISPNGTLTYTAAPDANGSAIIDVFLMDDGGTEGAGVDTSAVQQFTINVTPVNDAPDFSIFPSEFNLTESLIVDPFAENGWADDITAGPADESGQVLMFDTSNATIMGTLQFFTPISIDPATGNLSFTICAQYARRGHH